MTIGASRHREIACAIIIDMQGRFLLQQRDDVPGILFPGKVAIFGGHREGDETYLQCVVREIHEELSYFVAPERFEPLVTYNGSDIEAEGGTVHGELFVAREIPAERVHVTEGSLLIIERSKLFTLKNKLTPSAQFAIKIWLEKERTLKSRQAPRDPAY